MNIRALAGEAYDAFQSTTTDERTIITLKEAHRDGWMHELVHDAHREMMPDDWRYATIREACGFIQEHGTDAPEEFADAQVDVYTGNRLAWLSSNLHHRLGYCDAAREEGLVSETASLADRIGAGQYQEAEEIFASVLESLTARAEED